MVSIPLLKVRVAVVVTNVGMEITSTSHAVPSSVTVVVCTSSIIEAERTSLSEEIPLMVPCSSTSPAKTEVTIHKVKRQTVNEKILTLFITHPPFRGYRFKIIGTYRPSEPHT
jgi:hypothetical protein